MKIALKGSKRIDKVKTLYRKILQQKRENTRGIKAAGVFHEKIKKK